LGLLIFLIWWFKSLGVTLTITSSRTILRRGVLSKHTNEVLHKNVRNVQVSQSFLQRIFGVGDIGIASAGSAGIEIAVSGILSPQHVKDLIDKYRNGEQE